MCVTGASFLLQPDSIVVARKVYLDLCPDCTQHLTRCNNVKLVDGPVENVGYARTAHRESVFGFKSVLQPVHQRSMSLDRPAHKETVRLRIGIAA